MSRLSTLPIRAPRATLLVTAVITLVLGYFAASITVDSAVENLLPEDDPDRLYYNEVKRQFGSEEATMIALFAADVFAPATLRKIETLSERLGAIDGVREVLSLATIRGPEIDDVGAVGVGRLMRVFPETPEEIAAFKAKVKAHRLYAGNLVSENGTATGILVLFETLSDEEFLRRGIEDQIERAVAEFRGPEDFAISGLQTLKVNGARLMQEDLARFVPLSVLLVVVVLWFEFRTRRGVVLPLTAVLIGVVWTTGVMVLTGASITMGTLVLPPMLMAVGIAYSIHVISGYYREWAPGRSRFEVVSTSMDHLRVPVVVAWLTTVIGFMSFLISSIPAIREFGVYSILGITVISLIAVAFIPAALMVMSDPPETPAAMGDTWIAEVLNRCGQTAIAHRRLILILAALVCAAAAWATRGIRVETDYLSFFSPHSSFRRDNTRIAEALGGTQPIYVVVDGDGPGSITRLETLGAIRDLQAFMAEQPGIDSSLSVADYLEIIWGVVNPKRTTPLPDRQADVDQLLLFVNYEDFRPVVTPDFGRANIIVRTHLSGSAEVSALVARIEEYAKTRFRRALEVRATGTVVLLNRSADELAHGQIVGLAEVVIVLAVLMAVLFLSVRAGLLSLVPNVIPIVVLFGIMGAAGISLNISTSMIAGIAIGIAIDDTIHYLTAFNQHLRRTGSQEASIHYVSRSVGRPIVFTSIALTVGFLIPCLSNFQPIRHFGLLASTTMAVALVTELLITPALVMTTTIVTLWDLLFVKLGPQPQREIPLFSGMRPFQAKIVVLMARLAAAPPGTLITTRGELKSELYVLLNGRVDVLRGDHRVIRSLGRGDVIGEMALVRARPRSADVVVAEPTEYLVLDGHFLDRLLRRHPRIAAKVFLNLTRILSDRLENTTDQLAASGLAPRPAAGP